MFTPKELCDQECLDIYGANWITNFEVLNTPMYPLLQKTRANGYGNYAEPQEAEGDLRLHKSTTLGKIGQIRHV